MENLDLTKILKDVPKGTKLYSPIIGDVYFENIKSIKCSYAITCSNKSIGFLHFTKDGKYYNLSNGECLLFPSKEQRDWSKFDYHHANEEERTLLFDKLQEKGYFWNGETKSLEKYKFKVGDKIQDKVSKQIYTIYDIEHAKYKVNVNKDIQGYLFAAFQNQFELYKEKFDITTLKPYDKVLVRRNDNEPWEPQIFSFLDNNLKSSYCYKHVMIGGFSVKQCIPYEGNEYLIGTTNECNEYYKTWK